MDFLLKLCQNGKIYLCSGLAIVCICAFFKFAYEDVFLVFCSVIYVNGFGETVVQLEIQGLKPPAWQLSTQLLLKCLEARH